MVEDLKMEPKKENKKERVIKVGEKEYRRLHRREQQILKAKAYVRLAWNVLKKIDK